MTKKDPSKPKYVGTRPLPRRRTKDEKYKDVPGYLPEKERPRCPNCLQPLRMEVTELEAHKVSTATGFRTENKPTKIEYGYVFKGRRLFCMLRCAALFGLASYDAGYRREKDDS